jgi:hypothetical protein
MKRLIIVSCLVFALAPGAAFAAPLIDVTTNLAPVVGAGSSALSGVFGCSPGGGALTGAAAGILNHFDSAVGSVAGGVIGGDASAVPVTNSHFAPTDQNTKQVATKQCIIHPLVASLKQALIAALTQSIINWINSGFEGGPSFVTNLSQFLGQIADNTSLDFIKGSQLDLICSPFRPQIRIALALRDVPFRQSIQCSLGQVTDNIEGFLNGDFSQGGWAAWFSIATEIQNNPYGAYLMARDEHDNEVAAAVALKQSELYMNNGFNNKTQCVGVTEGATDSAGTPIDTSTQEGCTQAGGHNDTVTPGITIKDQLSHTLDISLDQLNVATEINQIINALLNQLASKALTALDGIRGLSSNSSASAASASQQTGGTGSYLDQLVNTSGGQSISAARDVLMMSLATSATLESEYQVVVTSTLTILEQEKATLTACPAGDATGAVTLDSIVAKTSTLQKSFAVSTSTGASLTAIAVSASTAATAEALNAAGAQYDAITQSGVMQTATSVGLATGAHDAEQSALDTLTSPTGGQCPVLL